MSELPTNFIRNCIEIAVEEGYDGTYAPNGSIRHDLRDLVPAELQLQALLDELNRAHTLNSAENKRILELLAETTRLISELAVAGMNLRNKDARIAELEAENKAVRDWAGAGPSADIMYVLRRMDNYHDRQH